MFVKKLLHGRSPVSFLLFLYQETSYTLLFRWRSKKL